MKIDTVERIGFAAEGNGLNGSNLDGIGVSGNSAVCSIYTAIGNSLNPSNTDTAMGSEVAAIGNEANEGSFSNKSEKQDHFSPTEVNQLVNQSTQTEPEIPSDDTEIVESQKTASTALTAFGSTSEVAQDKGSENGDCLRTGDKLPSELLKLPSAAPVNTVW